jgi:hypothetical protein
MLSFNSPGLLLPEAEAPALSSLSANAGGVAPLTGLPLPGLPAGEAPEAEYGVLPVCRGRKARGRRGGLASVSSSIRALKDRS